MKEKTYGLMNYYNSKPCITSSQYCHNPTSPQVPFQRKLPLFSLKITMILTSG